VLALFAVAYARGILTLPWLYGGIIMIASCAAFFVGAQSPSIPFLLGKRGAAPAVAALIAAEQAANMIVPPIGGALFALIGPLPALTFNAATYLTSQLSLALVPTLGPEAPEGTPSLRELTADIVDGLRIVMADAAMRAISWISCGLNFFGIMTTAVLIPFLERDLGASTAQVGICFGIIAAGSVFGSLLAGRFGSRWPFGQAMVIAYAVDAVIFIPVVLTHNLWFGMAFFALASACGAFEIAQIVAWRMRVAPEDKVGRVSAAVRLIALAGLVPGTLIGGWIADVFGARSALWVSALGFMLIAFSGVSLPALRRERR
jgi:MFS family permease